MTILNAERSVGYNYENALASPSESYLWPAVRRYLARACPDRVGRVFELGCGNGAFAASLHAEGYDVTAVDPSEPGIRIGREAHRHLRLEAGSAYDDLAARFGRFHALVSLEVVEHVYAPRLFARCAFDLLELGGVAIVTTPYHGYWKNLAIAATGKMDQHFTALWDHGHIKFWSPRTISLLMEEAGFDIVQIDRVGRIPPLAKSMVVVARKPTAVRQ